MDMDMFFVMYGMQDVNVYIHVIQSMCNTSKLISLASMCLSVQYFSHHNEQELDG